MMRHTAAEYFSDGLRLQADLADTDAATRVLEAFRNVPREAFAGPGPWRFRSPLSPRTTLVTSPDADPRWLYHDMLVVLDEAKGINIGQPSMWARLLAKTNIPNGARILQVGSGVGYYTAILSQLVGPDGFVFAYDVEAELIERATSNLADYDNVRLRHGNAATGLTDEGPFDAVIAFAGVTHVPCAWSTQLDKNSVLLLPLTGRQGAGAMILAQPDENGFSARTIGRCGFYHCLGARTESLAAKIDKMFSDPTRMEDWKFWITAAGETTDFVRPSK